MGGPRISYCTVIVTLANFRNTIAHVLLGFVGFASGFNIFAFETSNYFTAIVSPGKLVFSIVKCMTF